MPRQLLFFRVFFNRNCLPLKHSARVEGKEVPPSWDGPHRHRALTSQENTRPPQRQQGGQDGWPGRVAWTARASQRHRYNVHTAYATPLGGAATQDALL